MTKKIILSAAILVQYLCSDKERKTYIEQREAKKAEMVQKWSEKKDNKLI